MKTAILIDSGCDVSDELVQKYHMKVMPLHIIYPEKDYVDGVDIFRKRFIRDFQRRSPLPPRQVHKTLKIWWRK